MRRPHTSEIAIARTASSTVTTMPSKKTGRLRLTKERSKDTSLSQPQPDPSPGALILARVETGRRRILAEPLAEELGILVVARPGP